VAIKVTTTAMTNKKTVSFKDANGARIADAISPIPIPSPRESNFALAVLVESMAINDTCYFAVNISNVCCDRSRSAELARCTGWL
jgi:hypothetical protein